MLRLVWSLSIALALTSIFVMLVLIVRRVIVTRLEKNRNAAKARLNAALIRFTADEDKEKVLASLSGIPKTVIADAGFEFLALLRGNERREIEEVFAEIGIQRVIRKQLRQGNRSQRIFAAERLTAFPAAETNRALLAALRDRSRQVRIAAAIALGEMQALPPLADVMNMIGYRGQRSARIVDLFQTLGAERSEELRSVALDIRANALMRSAAIAVLGQTGDYSHLAFIREMTRDESADIAAAAVNAVGRLAHPSSAPTVIEALRHADWRVRSEAAQAVRLVGARDAIPELTTLLEDAEWPVRYWAAHALHAFGQEGIDMLRSIAEGDPSRSQRTASMVMAEDAA
ncbi:HEAT repeat domain-containing protein [Pseudohoeflea suaedae]|uniref:HEAT repeat domain-containing protein n=1 Tax=Pseudohoeflea suaedae TaxID=877384 RepID=A0A4R5PMA8_9HYPH|nr:HEAT repeat domain-containing protein [Pseudohoeflea suaedae]TDH38120.1 HEAT repeat domain-containing protein [Pseudohoeflea suaedae]